MADHAREIENLLYTYAERIDLGDLAGVADLFEHGRIAPMPDATPEQCAEGREAVFALYDSTVKLHEDTGTPKTHHVTSNAIIDVADGARSATARSYYTVFQQTDALPLQPIIAGRYHDTFQRIDGRWWFDTRTIHMHLFGDLRHHLSIDVG